MPKPAANSQYAHVMPCASIESRDDDIPRRIHRTHARTHARTAASACASNRFQLAAIALCRLFAIERITVQLPVMMHVDHDAHAARQCQVHRVIDAGHERPIDGVWSRRSCMSTAAHRQPGRSHTGCTPSR